MFLHSFGIYLWERFTPYWPYYQFRIDINSFNASFLPRAPSMKLLTPNVQDEFGVSPLSFYLVRTMTRLISV